MTKRILAIVMTLAMVISLAACTTPSGTSATTAPANTAATATAAGSTAEPGTQPTEEVTLTPAERVLDGETALVEIYPHSSSSMASGVLTSPIGTWLLETKNIKIDIWSYSEERTTTLLASGDLPDIMYINSVQNLENAILGGHLLNLEEHVAEIPHVANDADMQIALNYMRAYRSAGTGELWGMPTSVGGHAGASQTHVSRNRVFVWWDYFWPTYGANAPEINDPYDIITVMQDLVNAFPTASDGTKTYGTAIFYGYNKKYEYATYDIYCLYGYTNDNLAYMIESDAWNATYKSVLDNDSLYHYALEWYNEVYRLGLLDPDSINYDRDIVREKQKFGVGQFVISMPGPNVTDVDEWKTLYTNFQRSYYANYNQFGSDGQYISIGKNTDVLDACLTLMDSWANIDELLVWRDGPDGERWYSDENHNVFLSDGFVATYKDGGGHYTWNNGDSYELLYLNNVKSLCDYTSYGDGQTYIADITKWKETDALGRSERDEQWTETYGYEWTQDLLRAKGQLITASDIQNITNFMDVCPDDIQLLADSCSATIIDYSWKMIYAATDEEFARLWDECVKTLLDLGAQDVIDWRMEQIEKGTELKNALLG